MLTIQITSTIIESISFDTHMGPYSIVALLFPETVTQWMWNSLKLDIVPLVSSFWPQLHNIYTRMSNAENITIQYTHVCSIRWAFIGVTSWNVTCLSNTMKYRCESVQNCQHGTVWSATSESRKTTGMPVIQTRDARLQYSKLSVTPGNLPRNGKSQLSNVLAPGHNHAGLSNRPFRSVQLDCHHYVAPFQTCIHSLHPVHVQNF